MTHAPPLGKDAVETEEALKESHPHAGSPASARPEKNAPLISGVVTDKGRMAARSGLGAVMGSKRLKAVVLEGKQRIPVHQPEEIKRLSRVCNQWVQFQPPFIPGWLTGPLGALMRILPFALTQDGLLYKILLRKWGTVSMNQTSVEMGDAPIKNWTGTSRDWGMFRSRTSNPDRITKKEVQKFTVIPVP